MIARYKSFTVPWSGINAADAELAVGAWLHAADMVSFGTDKVDIDPAKFVRYLREQGLGTAWEYLDTIGREDCLLGISTQRRVEFAYEVLSGTLRVVLSLCAQHEEFTVVVEGQSDQFDSGASIVVMGVQRWLTKGGFEEPVRVPLSKGYSQWGQECEGYAHCILFQHE